MKDDGSPEILESTRFRSYGACLFLSCNRMCWISICMAAFDTSDPMFGITTSAWRRTGSTQVSKLGLTYRRYMSMTPFGSLPLSAMSRVILRARRTSASQSTKIRRSNRSLSSLSEKIRIPSTIITFRLGTTSVFDRRECVEKS